MIRYKLWDSPDIYQNWKYIIHTSHINIFFTFACSHVHTGHGQHLVMVCRTHPWHCHTTLFPAIVFFTLVCRNKPSMEYSTQSVADVFLSLGPVSHRQLNMGQATWVWGVCLCARVASANSHPAVSGKPVNVIDVIALECSVFTNVSLWIRWWAHGACTVSGGGLGIELAQCVHHVSTVIGHCYCELPRAFSRNL